MAYRIGYSPEVSQHLRTLTAAQRSLVLEAIVTQLVHEPTVQTRNRKQMKLNQLADWELRVRQLRVFYLVHEEPEPFVLIRAIGIKKGNRTFVGDEEVDWS